MPLLALESTQNSDLIWKSAYEFFDTRKPLPWSACTAPSASRQLALPIWFQLSRLEPSNSVVHPESPCPDGELEQPRMVQPVTSNAATVIDEPFIAISSLGLEAVQTRWIIHQDLAPGGRIRCPHRQLVQQAAVIDLEQGRDLGRLAPRRRVRVRPVRAPDDALRLGGDQRLRELHHVGVIRLELRGARSARDPAARRTPVAADRARRARRRNDRTPPAPARRRPGR